MLAGTVLHMVITLVTGAVRITVTGTVIKDFLDTMRIQ